MGKLTIQQYDAARAKIDEEVIGAYGQHKGQILDSWYDKLAAVLQIPWDQPTLEEIRVAQDDASKFDGNSVSFKHAEFILRDFVNRRNQIAQRIAKGPKDPREGKIAAILEEQYHGLCKHFGTTMYATPNFHKLAGTILKELQDKDGLEMSVAMGEEPGEYGNKFTQSFDPSCGGALSGKTFTVQQADAIIKYVQTATHGYVVNNMDEPQSPDVSYDVTGYGYHCSTCGQTRGVHIPPCDGTVKTAREEDK